MSYTQTIPFIPSEQHFQFYGAIQPGTIIKLREFFNEHKFYDVRFLYFGPNPDKSSLCNYLVTIEIPLSYGRNNFDFSVWDPKQC